MARDSETEAALLHPVFERSGKLNFFSILQNNPLNVCSSLQQSTMRLCAGAATGQQCPGWRTTSRRVLICSATKTPRPYSCIPLKTTDIVPSLASHTFVWFINDKPPRSACWTRVRQMQWPKPRVDQCTCLLMYSRSDIHWHRKLTFQMEVASA